MTLTRSREIQHPPGQALARIFAANERMNQILLERLDPAAWRAKPPGKVRTIAAIFTHMHNVRAKWIRLTAPGLGVPPQLNRTTCTPRQASAGLAESAVRCVKILDGADVRTFHRDGWARGWPAGLEMLCYMLMHEAHHRGQVCLLTHQLGFPLSNEVNSGLWQWEKIWKDCGWPKGPGYEP